MTTARERMLELTPLVGAHSARAHFLAITQGGGGEPYPVFASQYTVVAEEARYDVLQIARKIIDDVAPLKTHQRKFTRSEEAVFVVLDTDEFVVTSPANQLSVTEVHL